MTTTTTGEPQNRFGVDNSKSTVHFVPRSNAQLAGKLDRVAELLLAQGANRFRTDACHRAAGTIRATEEPLWKIYANHGLSGLETIQGVGRTISRALQQLIRGGHWALLERMSGNDVVEQAFASVPNIGSGLAKRIHKELGIQTLAELHAAAWDGRLRKLPGFGEKRIRAVRESLAVRGRNSKDDVANQGEIEARVVGLTSEVPIEEILDIDDEYRFKAAQGELPRIAPRRNNPRADAWLPDPAHRPR